MSFEKVIIGNAALYCGDCMEILPTLPKVDAVITDPPYPTYWIEEYKYKDGIINFLDNIDCIKFVFWTPGAAFPIKFDSCWVWDKRVGTHTQFELIYIIGEKMGHKILRYYVTNSSVAANMNDDVYTGHPSQKPIKLMNNVVDISKGGTILDPFMGSGTTGVACMNLDRKFIGIELEPKYFDIACRRIDMAQQQLKLF